MVTMPHQVISISLSYLLYTGIHGLGKGSTGSLPQ